MIVVLGFVFLLVVHFSSPPYDGKHHFLVGGLGEDPVGARQRWMLGNRVGAYAIVALLAIYTPDRLYQHFDPRPILWSGCAIFTMLAIRDYRAFLANRRAMAENCTPDGDSSHCS